MFSKVKSWLRHNRFFVSASCMMAMLLCSAFAAEGDAAFDLGTTMTTSVTTIVNDLLGMIGKVVPVTVTLLAAAIGINYGIRFIKRLIGKAG